MTVPALKPDFSGYATKANLECTDGRTILPQAFQHMDGLTVPLLWQHGHNDAENVLGHAVLEARADGVYCNGFFNETPKGKVAKAIVQHGDVKALSIFANKLVEKAKLVHHGFIREVSLVLAGANPGAFIQNVTLAHGDGDYETLEDTAIMSANESLEHIDMPDEDDELEHATVQEVYDSLTDEQKDVVHFMVGAALESKGSAEHSDDTGDSADDNEGDLNHQEGSTHMNVFDQNGGAVKDGAQHVLSHDDMKSIVADAVKGGSLKEAVEGYALKHGIENIEVLFPEAKNLTSTPEWDKRRTEWVSGVLSGTSKSPFSRVKSVVADITMEEARALGYIKGNLKKEEWFSVSKRTTTPTTIYKKQKLDRDDIIDITDFDVVAWMRGEMRMMLEEEIARAILIGDGRPVEDPANPGDPNPDKIKDPNGATDGAGIRSILHENELYAKTLNVPVPATGSFQPLVEAVMMGMISYKGSGTPTFYTTQHTLTKMLLSKDGMGRRLWRTAADLASEMGVDRIVPVEVMETKPELVGIIVNLRDYNVGADKGGEVTLFDDFDIDYNQNKYLIETRISGALTKIRSAIILMATASPDDDLVAPTAPTFNTTTGVATIPTKTGVVYKNADTNATLTAGAQTAVAPGATLNVLAVPASGYYFEDNQNDEWTFTRDAA